MQNILRHREQVTTASGLDVLAGLWLLLSPLVLGFSRYNLGTAATNNAIVGVCVAVLAALRAFGVYRPSWMSWTNAALGLWTLLTPWALGFSLYRTPTLNNIVVGTLVIILACWSAIASDADRVAQNIASPRTGGVDPVDEFERNRNPLM